MSENAGLDMYLAKLGSRCALYKLQPIHVPFSQLFAILYVVRFGGILQGLQGEPMQFSAGVQNEAALKFPRFRGGHEGIYGFFGYNGFLRDKFALYGYQSAATPHH